MFTRSCIFNPFDRATHYPDFLYIVLCEDFLTDNANIEIATCAMGGVASIPTDPSQKVEVISAGYSRIGTVSMSLALQKLRNGPVLHGGTQILVQDDGEFDPTE